MGRKAVEIAPEIKIEMGNRLYNWLKEIGMNQSELANKVNYTQQYISSVIRGKKNMSADLASAISMLAIKPLYNAEGTQIGFDQVRPEYLLCIDDIKTKEEFSQQFVKRQDALYDSCLVLLESSLREVCLREQIPIPTLDNIPELLFLEAQLRDFSDSLIWNYVKWKNNSHVWSLLKQAGKATKRKKENENNG